MGDQQTALMRLRGRDITLRRAAEIVSRKYIDIISLADADDNELKRDIAQAYRENAEHAAKTNEQWKHTSTEADEHLGPHPDKD
ncbi:hypothetical protein [Haloarcula nitratireducens]|uniref:hypothetical protein n=1 Tax=Haloarcula nitratireducens TaxID=2487749 RepID=UPI001C73A1B0|nr:hypothetical protein [Halomicroarcula nitratireducens]